ncbi:MAG: hypothetical protein IJD88_00105 [Clostridia bacterium]|nr:hypothetical protein [Clostridia bacterium]
MLNIYPVTKTADYCSDYKVKINGIDASLNTARVSAVPFNRRWPGHQRGLEQTELVNFLSCETDESLTFEITPPKPFEKVYIKPLSLGIDPEITADGKIVFTLDKPAHFTVEPYVRNNALHIFADPVKKYNINKDAENVIYYGQGEHDVGLIILKSNQTLFIDEGAVVYARVIAEDSDNIKILGRGILDNSKNKEEILYECNLENNDSAVNNAVREHTIKLDYCTNIEIDGITIRDSLLYNIKPSGCKKIHINNVKIIGCWRYNSDGIDMHNCENVLIENCFLRTFDDSICVKGFDFYFTNDNENAEHDAIYRNGQVYDTFKNVVIRNCTIWTDWGKSLEIGAETKAKEIYDIVFEDCNIIHVCFDALDCFNVDYADVHDVLYQNINVEYDDIIPKPCGQTNDAEVYVNTDSDYYPNIIAAVITFHKEYSGGGLKRGINRNLTFRNIHVFGRHAPKVHFRGYDDAHKIKDVVIENLYWNEELVTELPDERFFKNDFTENIVITASDFDKQ